MSSTTSSSISHLGAIILGGIPKSKDLVPSIVFAAAYGILLPIWVYRMVKKETRSLLILRPGIFIQVRIATMALRAVMSRGNYSSGLFIAELILLTAGLVLLLEPLIQCFQSLARPFHTSGTRLKDLADAHWLGRVAFLLKILLLGILVTGIASGAMASGAISDPNGSSAQTLHALRITNYVLCLVVIVAVLLATAFVQRTYSSQLNGAFRALFLIGAASPLLVSSAFKIATLNRAHPEAWVHSSSAFFVLLITFEYLTCAMLVVVPLTLWFPSAKAQRKLEGEEEMTEGQKDGLRS